MPAAMRQQGVGALKWRFLEKFKENGKQKTPQAKTCGEFQRMGDNHNAEHSKRFDKRSFD